MMKFRQGPATILLSLFVFWLCIFIIARTVFIVYQWPLISGLNFSSILATYLHGFSMDVSMACYLLIVPFFLLTIADWANNQKFIDRSLKYFHFILLIPVVIIVSAELELFVEWESKLNYRALTYLANPSEVWGVTSFKVFVVSIGLMLFQFFIGLYLYRKLVQASSDNRRNRISKLIFSVLTPIVLFIGIRGGFQQIPINQSRAYFTSNNTLNNAAVNSVWNFMHSVSKHETDYDSNPFNYFDKEKAESIIQSLYPNTGSPIKVMKDMEGKINVVLVILEGWSSDLIEPLGGYEGITPEFNALCDSGYLFTNIYASGLRSNEGVASILSGLPAMPIGAVTRDISKYKNLPFLNRTFQEYGYETFFGFGGELEYGNIKSYLLYAGFDKVIQESDFDNEVPRAKLGVHDEFALPRFVKEMNDLKEPFFASWFTISSHAPYDIPREHKLDVNGLEKGYVNSVNYSDEQLGKFIEQVKKKDWYNNTLFVIISDHGHSSPKKRPFYDADYRKIPILLYGDVLRKDKIGMKNDMIGSQTDLATTVLNQLKMDSKSFKWSKDLLNDESKPFAYYAFDDGYGWIDTTGGFSYHLKYDRLLWLNYKDSSALDIATIRAKSYLQESFKHYLGE